MTKPTYIDGRKKRRPKTTRTKHDRVVHEETAAMPILVGFADTAFIAQRRLRTRVGRLFPLPPQKNPHHLPIHHTNRDEQQDSEYTGCSRVEAGLRSFRRTRNAVVSASIAMLTKRIRLAIHMVFLYRTLFLKTYKRYDFVLDISTTGKLRLLPACRHAVLMNAAIHSTQRRLCKLQA